MTSENQASLRNESEFLSKYWRGQAELEERQLKAHKAEIEAFKALAAMNGVSLHELSFSYAQKIGIVATAPSLVGQLIGPLDRQRDGLLSFSMLTRDQGAGLHAGYIPRDQFTLMAHPHFRRGLHGINHFAPRFIDLFWAFEKPGVSKYVALDEDRVTVNTDGGYVMEFDTWFGAPFREDVSQVKDSPVKLVPPAGLDDSLVSLLFADAHCLDINWSTKDGIKTFQAQEFKSEAVRLTLDGQTVFPVRYIHAEFDTSSGLFRHFDGAMQYFTEPDYRARRDSDFNYNAKFSRKIKARSKKLFKLNGDIDTATWTELCCQFLPGNPLMFEYFSGAYPGYLIEKLAMIEADRQRDG